LLEHNAYEVVAHGTGLLTHAHVILLDPTQAFSTISSHDNDEFPTQFIVDANGGSENGVDIFIYLH
jgi:hypothetical protein